MAIASIMFWGFALMGLIILTVGIIFLVKNIKWKKQKEEQGLSTTSNIIAIVMFSLMIFFGLMWMICFGVAGIVFMVAL